MLKSAGATVAESSPTEPAVGGATRPSRVASMQTVLYFPPKLFSARFGAQFFTIKMEKYDVVDKGSARPVAVSTPWPCACLDGPFVEYLVDVTQGSGHWCVRHRYSDFSALHQSIQALLPNGEASPQLPAKTMWSIVHRDDDLEARREALEVYLHNLLSIYSNKRLVIPQPIVDFLKIKPIVTAD